MRVNYFLMKVITSVTENHITFIRRLHNIAGKQVNKQTNKQKTAQSEQSKKALSPNGKNIVINFGFSDEFNSEGKKRALIYRTKIACVKRNQSFSKSVHSLLTATLSKFDHSVRGCALEFIFHKTSPEEVPPC